MNLRIARALATQWIVVLVLWAVAASATLVYVHVLRGAPEPVLETATIGLRNISVPVLDNVSKSGLPDFLGFLLVNGIATLVLFVIPLSARLADPSRKEVFPRLLRKSVFNDPSQYLFYPIPAFRRIRNRDLKPLFEVLAGIPLLVPVLVGLLVGVVTGLLIDPADLLRTGVFAVALVLPHGVFELTALFMAPAGLFALYGRVRKDLEAGETEAVWTVLRPELTLRTWAPRLAVALLLILVAAVIEAQWTEAIGNAFAERMGLAFP